MSIKTLELYHGSNDVIQRFNGQCRHGMFGGLVYLGNIDTALKFGHVINRYKISIDTSKYNYKVCKEYNYDTYITLLDLRSLCNEYDIVTVPLALDQPFNDFVNNILLQDNECLIQKAVECHKNKRYDDTFVKMNRLKNNKMIEDPYSETVIFNPGLLSSIRFMGALTV